MYVRAWEGWLYLAVVIDLFSRRVVGCATADHLRAELCLDALKMAIGGGCPTQASFTTLIAVASPPAATTNTFSLHTVSTAA